MVGGQQMDTDGTAEFLVHRTPTAEAVQTGDALFEAIAPREFVTTVQFGR